VPALEKSPANLSRQNLSKIHIGEIDAKIAAGDDAEMNLPANVRIAWLGEGDNLSNDR
jgi:hypothetical protein